VLELPGPHREFLEWHINRSGHAAAAELPILADVEDADCAIPEKSVELVDTDFGSAKT
jgi:hypothetical protein